MSCKRVIAAGASFVEYRDDVERALSRASAEVVR